MADGSPELWARILCSLAADYCDRKIGDRAKNLERAALYCNSALPVLQTAPLHEALIFWVLFGSVQMQQTQIQAARATLTQALRIREKLLASGAQAPEIMEALGRVREFELQLVSIENGNGLSQDFVTVEGLGDFEAFDNRLEIRSCSLEAILDDLDRLSDDDFCWSSA